MRTLCLLILVALTGCQKSDPVKPVLNIDGSLRQAAAAEFEPEILTSALATIKDFHAINNTGLILNPPASQAEIDTAESAFGCRIPRELNILWRWHNGESTEKFIWYHRFLSSENAVREYRELTSAPDSTWKKEWIPVFEFEGEWYGVECAGQQAAASPVVFYFVESGESVAYTNLTRYMQVMANAMEKNVLGWSDDWWVDNVQGMADTHGLFNKEIPFPYYVGH